MRARALMVAVLLVLVGQGCGSTSSSQPQGTLLYELGSFVLPQREPGSATLTGAWLEVSRLDGSGRRALTPRPARRERRADGDAAWSPDGSRVAFVREALPGGADESGRQALYVVGIDGSHLRKLVDSDQVGAGIEHPIWSPDGKSIVFQRNIVRCWRTVEYPSDLGLYVVRADGSRLRQLPTPPAGSSSHPFRKTFYQLIALNWAADAKTLLYLVAPYRSDCLQGFEEPDQVVVAISADGSQRREVVRATGLADAQLAPTAIEVGYTTRDPKSRFPCDLFVRDIDDQRSRLLLHLPSGRCSTGLDVGWMPSQPNEMVFGAGETIGTIETRTKRTRLLFPNRHVPRSCSASELCSNEILDISADGKKIAFERDTSSGRGVYVITADGRHLWPIRTPKTQRGVEMNALLVHVQ